MALGTFIAINEELSGRVHPELLTLAGALLAGPAAVALYHTARRKDGKREPRSTTGSSSGGR